MCLLVLPLGGAISHYICSAQVPFSSQSHSCPTNIHSSGVSQPHHFGLRWGNETRQLKVLFSEVCLKHEAITSGDDCKRQNTQTQDSFFDAYKFLSYPRSPELQPHKIIDSCPVDLFPAILSSAEKQKDTQQSDQGATFIFIIQPVGSMQTLSARASQ